MTSVVSLAILFLGDTQMKKAILVIALVLSTMEALNAQGIDTTLKAFFPLAVGNYWEYAYQANIPDSYGIRITQDTLIQGRRYFKVYRRGPYYGEPSSNSLMGYFRINDSMMVVGRQINLGFWARQTHQPLLQTPFDVAATGDTTWEGDQLLYKLSASVGDYWWLTRSSSANTIRKVSSVTQNGRSYTDSVFNGSMPIFNGTIVLNRGYGFVYEEIEQSISSLVGVIINGVQQGTITTSLYNRLDAPRETTPQKATGFKLSQNYPNPFNPTTIISYQLPVSSQITLKVYDVLGREVATLVNERKAAGSYEATFDAGKLASGVYLYKLQAGEFVSTKKMLLVK
jgi:hypothetical protein